MNFAARFGCTAVGLRPPSVAAKTRIKSTTEPRQKSTYQKAKPVRTSGATSVDFSQPQRRLLNKQPDGAVPTLMRGTLTRWAAFDLDRSLLVPGIDWRTHPRE